MAFNSHASLPVRTPVYLPIARRRGVVVSGVNARRARLVLGRVTVFGRVYHIGMQPANWVNSALHPSGVDKSSTSFGWGKGEWNASSAGWQVTLCDSIWQAYVSSRSGVAGWAANCCIHILYFTYFTSSVMPAPPSVHLCDPRGASRIFNSFTHFDGWP